jgi:excinuclease ABC subunit C
MPANDQIRKKIGELPHKPGVYLMKDRFGTVIYVGKARDLRKRVSTYFHPSRRMGWDLKLHALIEAVHDLDTYSVRTEPEALLLEGKLIKEYHPRYNISFRDDKRFLLVKINLNDPIPRFVLTRLRQDDGARYFGPFVHSSSARHTLTLARRKFNLRGCRPFTPGQEDYKHCLRPSQVLHRSLHRQRLPGRLSPAGRGGVRVSGRPNRRNGARVGGANEKGGRGGGF